MLNKHGMLAYKIDLGYPLMLNLSDRHDADFLCLKSLEYFYCQSSFLGPADFQGVMSQV